MAERQKLELTWIGKENRPRLEPRILLEDPGKSCHAGKQETTGDIFDNRLIFGDNLLALKALEQEFAGKVKCVFIDPPYNTGAAFEHYDDGVEHSVWLSLMRDRLEILRTFLSEDGLIWITLDDNEIHYLKILCDEIFGRPNFLGTVIWEKSDSPRMDARNFSSRHDYVLCYCKDIVSVKFKALQLDTLPSHYDQIDSAGQRYYLKPLRGMGGQGDSRLARPKLYYALTAPDGSEIYPKRQDGSDGAWRWSQEKSAAESDRIEWKEGRNGWVPYFRIYEKEINSRPPETIWFHADVGSNRTSKAELKALMNGENVFATPKPEKLVQRTLLISTNPGDLVLDSFAGSGTTGAVAHKMGRRWIMVELGEHIHTHIIPRMKKVIDGADPGGITEAVGWTGGGGFRYYTLAPSLIEQDRFGMQIISKKYNAEMLAEAMCKLLGYTYAPNLEVYWQQGHSTESDFLYVTTQTLSHEQLTHLSEEVGDGRSLYVACTAFRGKAAMFGNLTVEKIPSSVLARCEWGKDDYSLEVKNLPQARGPEPPPQMGLFS